MTLEVDGMQTTKSITGVEQRVGVIPFRLYFQLKAYIFPNSVMVQYLFCWHKNTLIEFLYVIPVTLNVLVSDEIRRKQQKTQFNKSKNISKELYLKIYSYQL